VSCNITATTKTANTKYSASVNATDSIALWGNPSKLGKPQYFASTPYFTRLTAGGQGMGP